LFFYLLDSIIAAQPAATEKDVRVAIANKLKNAPDAKGGIGRKKKAAKIDDDEDNEDNDN